MRLCFLSSSRGNRYMRELLEGVASVAARSGLQVSTAVDRYPEFDDDTAWVVIPHEFFDTAPGAGWPTERHLQRTIGFCVEHPGTHWFERTCVHAVRLGALVDIRARTLEELRRRGLSAEHFRLGYVPEWDCSQGDELAPRPVDVTYLASADQRRARALAGYGETLWPHSCRLIIAPQRPKTEAAPNYLIGAEKHALFRSSKVLLNVHRSGAQGLEWPRVIEAMSNGCVVVSEHSDDFAPLVAGEHFISAHVEHLALLADSLLRDPGRLADIRRAAYRLLHDELSMEPSVQRLASIAQSLIKRPIRYAPWPAGAMPEPPPIDDGPLAPSGDRIGAALKRLLIEVLELRSELTPPDAGQIGDAPPAETWTPAYPKACPRVSVGVALYNYEREVVDALRSACASDYESFEIVVVDDASTDGSLAAVTAFAEKHESFPIRIVASGANRGPGAVRNTLLNLARGEFLFVLDADNSVFPPTLRRLAAALEADPEAAFAYGILAEHEGTLGTGLLSEQPWDPESLGIDNAIDMMSMLRRSSILAVGGFSPDRRLAGYEDYDLWCRLAEADRYGVLVPQIVGRYQRSQHSMLSLTTLDTTHARSLMRARAPKVWGGPELTAKIAQRLPLDRLVAGIEVAPGGG